MAEAVEHTLRKALIAHEPEPATLPVVFRTSWRVFTSHLRFLLTTAAATAAIPLLVVLALTAIFGPIIQPPTDQPFPWGPPNVDSHGRYSPAPAPHGHYAPAPAPTPPAPKVNPVAFAVATTVNFLLSAGAHVILIAVFVYVVLGDHVGRKPGPVWGVIKSSFLRLIGTDIAQSLVTILVTFVLGALVALIGGVVTGVFFKGASPNFAAATTLVIWLVLALPPTLFIIVGLSLADQTTAIEGGAGVWGFAALRRSWALSKGSRAAILAVILLSALVSIVLGSPLEILVNNFQDGSAFAGTWWQVLLAILGALVVFLLSVFIQAYLQVVWVELYLSSRKKAEPEFGLSAIERYFEAGATGTGGYSQARTWDA